MSGADGLVKLCSKLLRKPRLQLCRHRLRLNPDGRFQSDPACIAEKLFDADLGGAPVDEVTGLRLVFIEQHTKVALIWSAASIWRRIARKRSLFTLSCSAFSGLNPRSSKTSLRVTWLGFVASLLILVLQLNSLENVEGRFEANSESASGVYRDDFSKQ